MSGNVDITLMYSKLSPMRQMKPEKTLLEVFPERHASQIED